MSRQVLLAEITDQFPVYQSDGYTKKSGETVFTTTVWRNGVAQAISPTIVEIGSSGEYKITFIPDNFGFWVVEVLIDYNKDLWYGEYDIAPNEAECWINVSYDDSNSTLYMETWLTRFGAVISDANLVSCQIDVYAQDGTLLFSDTSNTPRSNDRFSLTEVVSLDDDRPYNVTVTIVDNLGTVKTFHAFTTVQ